MSFKSDIKLDILDLDVAALKQASLYEETGEAWAEAVAERDNLKDKISLKRAELDEAIRADPEKYGISGRVTENSITNKINQEEEIQKLNTELLEAQYNVNVMAVRKDTLDHRLKSLSILTELFKGNYFRATSRTHAPHELAMENSQEKQRIALEESPRMKNRLEKMNKELENKE